MLSSTQLLVIDPSSLLVRDAVDCVVLLINGLLAFTGHVLASILDQSEATIFHHFLVRALLQPLISGFFVLIRVSFIKRSTVLLGTNFSPGYLVDSFLDQVCFDDLLEVVLSPEDNDGKEDGSTLSLPAIVGLVTI